MSANKHDNGKPMVGLLPADALMMIARVFTAGAAEYGAHNWERGLEWSRIHNALGRHMLAWQMGEKRCPKSGFPHLAHAACNILMLLAHELRGIGADDIPRTPTPPPADDDDGPEYQDTDIPPAPARRTGGPSPSWFPGA